MRELKQSQTTAQLRRVPLLALDENDGFTEETGISGSMTARVTKANRVSAAAAGTITELELGQYDYEFTAGEIDELGYILVRFIDSAMKTFYFSGVVIESDASDIQDIRRALYNRMRINNSNKRLELFNDAGTSIIQSWDMKNVGGSAQAAPGDAISERDPV